MAPQLVVMGDAVPWNVIHWRTPILARYLDTASARARASGPKSQELAISPLAANPLTYTSPPRLFAVIAIFFSDFFMAGESVDFPRAKVRLPGTSSPAMLERPLAVVHSKVFPSEILTPAGPPDEIPIWLANCTATLTRLLAYGTETEVVGLFGSTCTLMRARSLFARLLTEMIA